jgi:alkanesulfonate monooxygenase SsuD/methylene tetrahydromethanopterin reductase-like flavin-dependent oxidoreductase (luciferase family)
VKPVIEAYRAAFDANVARINVAPKLGLARHVHVAETDSLAEASARRAYAVWYDANAELWRRFQTESFVFAKTYDEAIARGVAFVGSPETVAGKIKEAFAATGANYLVGRFAFGDLTVEEVSRCVRLFETRIMPRF